MNSKKAQSRILRAKQTSAEKIVWQRLRGRRFQNLKFRRQHNIEKFIVDFYCEKINLIIEIDGDVHGYRNKMEKDRVREEFLRDKGFEIIRYANNDIYNNLESVMEDLWIRCEKLKKDKN